MRIEDVLEVPISSFRDGLGRVRTAQLCACSISEFHYLLFEAWSRGWAVVTLLMHSFELIRRRPPRAHRRSCACMTASAVILTIRRRRACGFVTLVGSIASPRIVAGGGGHDRFTLIYELALFHHNYNAFFTIEGAIH
jgi:hypothetical protein